jgi:hypothetical protein
MDLDRLRLTVQGVLAVGVLSGATYLASHGTITSDAVVGLYSVALGAVGAGAVGGYRAQHADSGIAHTHVLNGPDQTGQVTRTETA